MSALWHCEICQHDFIFVPELDEDGKPVATRPKECPRCKIPDPGAGGTLDSLEG